jgi:hypothetical protein
MRGLLVMYALAVGTSRRRFASRRTSRKAAGLRLKSAIYRSARLALRIVLPVRTQPDRIGAHGVIVTCPALGPVSGGAFFR